MKINGQLPDKRGVRDLVKGASKADIAGIMTDFNSEAATILPTRIFLLGIALVLGVVAPAQAGLTVLNRWPSGDNVCVDAPLRLTFDQAPVTGPAGRIEVVRISDGRVVDSVDLAASVPLNQPPAQNGTVLHDDPVWIEGSTAQIRLHARVLGYGESFAVRVTPGFFKDSTGQDFAGFKEGWTFKTPAAMPRNPDKLTMAADGSGDFCTVQGAVDHVGPHREQPTVIFIRKGRYHELVRIGREFRQVHLVGEDRSGTLITCTNNEKLNSGWIQRAVLGVEGDDFVLENLTVQNATPYKGSQAEAVYVNAERCVLRKADFKSFQDTLHLSGRVYVADCRIEGDVDYVWGYGTACLERCELHALHDGYLVQARNPASHGGYLFLDCHLTAASGVKKSWLARIEADRFPASQVALVRCSMGAHIPSAGWTITGPAGDALRFQEFGSMDLEGKPLDSSRRDAAAKTLSADQAATMTAAAFLGGNDHWEPK